MSHIGPAGSGPGEKPEPEFSSLPEAVNSTSNPFADPSPQSASQPAATTTSARRPKPLAPWSPDSFNSLNPNLASPSPVGLSPIGVPSSANNGGFGPHALPPPYLASEPPSPAYSAASYAPLHTPGLGPPGEMIQPPSSPYFSPYGAGPGGGAPAAAANPDATSTDWVPMARPPAGLGPVAQARARRSRHIKLAVFCCLPLLLVLIAVIVGLAYGIGRLTRASTTY